MAVSPACHTHASANVAQISAARHLFALRAKREFQTRCDDHGSRPPEMGKGKIVLSEFGFGGEWFARPAGN